MPHEYILPFCLTATACVTPFEIDWNIVATSTLMAFIFAFMAYISLVMRSILAASLMSLSGDSLSSSPNLYEV